MVGRRPIGQTRYMAVRRWRRAGTRFGIGILALALVTVLLFRVVPRRSPPDERWDDLLGQNETVMTSDAQEALRTGTTKPVTPNSAVFNEVSIRPVYDTDLTVGAGENEDIQPSGNGVYFTKDETGGMIGGHLDLLYWPDGSGHDRMFACGQDGHGILRQSIAPNWYEEHWVDCDDFILPSTRGIIIGLVWVGGIVAIFFVTFSARPRERASTDQ